MYQENLFVIPKGARGGGRLSFVTELPFAGSGRFSNNDENSYWIVI